MIFRSCLDRSSQQQIGREELANWKIESEESKQSRASNLAG